MADTEPISLSERAAGKFLRDLAAEPFLCVVIMDDEVRFYSKKVDPERLARARESLMEAMGDDDGNG